MPKIIQCNKVMTWIFYVDESSKDRFNIILCRDLLTRLGLDIKFSDHVIIYSVRQSEGFSAPMVDVNNYDFIT